MGRILTFILSSTVILSGMRAAEPLYLDDNAPIEARVDDALRRMTLDEKIALIHAQSKFSTPGVPRLGIPEIWADDGPQGVREENKWDEWGSAGHTNDSTTAYPSLMSVAASWDPAVAELYGRSIGEEFRYRNKTIALTPGINIYRHPLCGRNFEYMGEDPVLAGDMAAAAVRGIQSQGVAACVKHFALNNQEVGRHKVDVVLSDRALHEIYLPAFRRVVRDGGVWAVMGAYNRYKGQFACHNEHLNRILKGDWGFDGVFISDWGGTEDTRQAALNGLDLEFGTFTDGLGENKRMAPYDDYYLARPFRRLIESGEIPMEVLDDKVRRVLRLCMRTVMDRRRPFGSLNSPQHSADALRIQEEGIVLLKNEGSILPLDPSRYRRVLVVGENADFRLTLWGGSSAAKARYEVMPLDAIRRALGDRCEVEYAKGYTSDWPPQPQVQDSLRLAAIDAAGRADLVIFVGGHNKYPNHDNEGSDRVGSGAPFRQGELLSRLVEGKAPVVLVTFGANQFDMPYASRIPAMLHAWYGGSESGTALARVLAGEVNPSGKLPVTFYRKLDDCGAIALGEYPGDGDKVRYLEDIYVGYRYVDREDISPAFPFGHGLSYTSFSYGTPRLSRSEMSASDTLEIRIPVKNTGKRPGRETVQLYVSDLESSLPRPVKELKGFDKLTLAPGETAEAVIRLTADDLSFYDPSGYCGRGGWVAEPGRFRLLIGSSSRDIRRKAEITLR